MSDEMDFFIFLLESYACRKEKSASDVLKELDSLQLTEYVISMFERYHTESVENAFYDIDRLICEKVKAV